MATVPVEQLNVPVVDADALGADVFVVTLVSATFVQPLPGSVTVKVYVPATLTEAVGDVEENPEGPVH
jgi:hypothetical protein